jgi:hypothetical protein
VFQLVRKERIHLCSNWFARNVFISVPTCSQGFFFLNNCFVLDGYPTPHPISSRPHFVCKFSRQGSSSPVTSHLSPSITVLVFPDFADAYSRTTASYRLTQLFRPNTRVVSFWVPVNYPSLNELVSMPGL